MRARRGRERADILAMSEPDELDFSPVGRRVCPRLRRRAIVPGSPCEASDEPADPGGAEAPFVAHALARVAELRVALAANVAVRVIIAGNNMGPLLGKGLAVDQWRAAQRYAARC